MWIKVPGFAVKSKRSFIFAWKFDLTYAIC